VIIAPKEQNINNGGRIPPEENKWQTEPRRGSILPNRIAAVQNGDPSTSSGQTATLMLSREEKDERSVARDDEQDY